MRLQVKGLGWFRDWGVAAPMHPWRNPLPLLCGWRHVCAQRTLSKNLWKLHLNHVHFLVCYNIFRMLYSMSLSEVVLNSPVAVRHHRLPAKLFPINSHVKNILSLPSLKRASRDLQASRGPGKPLGASKALEEYLGWGPHPLMVVY